MPSSSNNDAETIPIFPLPVVLFPGMKLPLVVFEPRYVEMIREITDANAEMGVTLYLDTQVENVAVATAVGTLARIIAVDAQTEGRLAILVEGVRRFKITGIDSESKPYLMARVSPYEDDRERTAPSALREDLIAAFRQMLALYAQTHAAKTDDRDDPDAASEPPCETAQTTPPPDAPEHEAGILADFDATPLSTAFQEAMETVMDDLIDFEALDFATLGDTDLTFRVAEFLNHDETIQQKLLEMRACDERMTEEKLHLDALTRRLALMRQINAVFDETRSDDAQDGAE